MRFVFGKHGKANALQLPTGLPQVLARVVDNDSDTDNRTCAMSCLNNIAIYAPLLVVADRDLVACALRVVQGQGTGTAPPSLPVLRESLFQLASLRCFITFDLSPSPPTLPTADMTAWAMSAKFGCTLMANAVGFLHTVSCSAAGAVALRLMDAHAALVPISSLPDADEHHTAHVALMCLINIMGNQETRTKGQDSPIMRLRPDVVGVGNAAALAFQRCRSV